MARLLAAPAVTPFAMAVLTAALSGCVPEVDDNLSRVVEPRLLAIRATPAEVGAQKEASLEALVAAADGTVSATVDWQVCLDRKPLTELGPVSQSCLERVPEGDETRVGIGAGDAVSFTTVRDVCSLFGPTAPPPKAGEVKGGRAVDPDPTGGFYQPVVAFIAGVPTLGAVRLDCGLPTAPREAVIAYNEAHKPNANPEIARLSLIDGKATTELDPGAESASAAVRAGRTVNLRAEWQACPRKAACGDGVCSEGEEQDTCADDCETPVSCGGAESYVWYDTDAREVRTRREAIVVSWYATAGDFTERRTGVSEPDPDRPRTETTWTAPSKRGEVKLWAVVRDDRGGVSWETYRVSVE